MSELSGLVEMIQPGRVCHLGRVHSGGFALWLVAGGEPIAVYPDDEPGWAAARDLFMRWEQQPQAPASYVGTSHAGAWSGVVVFVIIAALYVAYHAYKYHHCLNSPGLFAWPSSCI